jgi:hypothetical protein
MEDGTVGSALPPCAMEEVLMGSAPPWRRVRS